ncbi:alpha/beta hydrolase family protein [Sphingosinicella rhizophila]|uniref:Peptidase S9 prolyl oligopeptidase catalytic domain-containing protein n=1 Tax=Sphingosinicella rhizophila TaxID=3050082 RepID=A0ABU3Q9M6_9SPHN|nr:hypothetical protein [Sphingosinicella sp. GR2756]MDT9600110.1 hypothetical protein [Sphingosinicella sp. GR2756]
MAHSLLCEFSQRGEDAAKFFNALRLLGKPAVLLEYEGEGHVPSEWSVPNAADLAERAVKFLDEHVKQSK